MKKILDSQNIIVTGTARGMGKQMVETFASFGANVIAHARIENDEHEEYCNTIAQKYGVMISPIYFDISSEESVKNAVKSIRAMKVTIDGLVNNAGITYNALFQMTDIGELRRQFETNFFGPFLLTQYISKLMVRNKKGSIVNISSSAALDGNAGKSAYGASKAALLTMTLSIAEELGISGVRANVICPGVTETDMISTMPDYIIDIQKDATFLKRLGTVSDIANTAAFLLSDYSSYITGQVIRVDGGVTNYVKR